MPDLMNLSASNPLSNRDGNTVDTAASISGPRFMIAKDAA